MWLICLLSYLGLDDLPLAPIYGASFYKVHAFADVTVLEIGVELEGGGGGGECEFFVEKPNGQLHGWFIVRFAQTKSREQAAHPNHAHK